MQAQHLGSMPERTHTWHAPAGSDAGSLLHMPYHAPAAAPAACLLACSAWSPHLPCSAPAPADGEVMPQLEIPLAETSAMLLEYVKEHSELQKAAAAGSAQAKITELLRQLADKHRWGSAHGCMWHGLQLSGCWWCTGRGLARKRAASAKLCTALQPLTRARRSHPAGHRQPVLRPWSPYAQCPALLHSNGPALAWPALS